MKNNFIKEITQRGFFHQCTDQTKLTDLLNQKSTKAYIALIVRLQAFMSEVYCKLCA